MKLCFFYRNPKGSLRAVGYFLSYFVGCAQGILVRLSLCDVDLVGVQFLLPLHGAMVLPIRQSIQLADDANVNVSEPGKVGELICLSA